MNNWNQNQNSRLDERKEDKPPYSRLFIVCSKDLQEDDLREPFEKFGDIEDVFMPKDRATGERKGIAYIKFRKTSSAAAAIEDLHLKIIANSNKPIKVMLASSKNYNKNDNKTDEKHNRLFIKVSKQATESEIDQYFSQFGKIESVYIQKDKVSDESKGLAYVQFDSFYDAAKAYEECEPKYKPVFAAPKHELKRSRDSDVYNDSFHSSNSSIRKDNFNDYYGPPRDDMMTKDVSSLIRTAPQSYNTVLVTCTPQLPQKFIERLFYVIPGMVQFQYAVDTYNGLSKALVSYEDEKAAVFAVERLNNFEFPSGEVITVRPDNPLSKAANELTSIVNSFKNAVDSGNTDLVQLADAIAQASTLIKAATSVRTENRQEIQDPNYCNVILPPPQPIANINSRVAQRCFIVCKPHPPSLAVLRDVFRRFGDLIDVSTFPNKTFGFAKYASVKAAQDAIRALHGAVVCGIKLKVLKADEKVNRDDDQKMCVDSDMSEYTDRKRIRLHDTESD